MVNRAFKALAALSSAIMVAGIAPVGAAIASPIDSARDRATNQNWPIHAEVNACGPNDVIFRYAPGTWETNAQKNRLQDPGMIGKVSQLLQKSANGIKVDAQQVPYPAQFGGVAGIATQDTISYTDSRNIGVKNLIKELERMAAKCPNTKLAVAGYSQGADVAGDAAESIALGETKVKPEQILGVFLFADPKRAPSTQNEDARRGGNVGPRVKGASSERLISNKDIPGGGVIGTRRDFKDLSKKVVTFCTAGDMVCATPKSDNSITGILGAAGGDSRGRTSGQDTGLGELAKDVNLKDIDKAASGDPASILGVLQNLDPNSVGSLLKAGLDPKTYEALSPETIAGLGSLIGSTGTGDAAGEGHGTYASLPVAPWFENGKTKNMTPVEWTVKSILAAVKQK